MNAMYVQVVTVEVWVVHRVNGVVMDILQQLTGKDALHALRGNITT